VTSLREAQQQAGARLRVLPHAEAELEAALLLCHLLDKPRSHLYAWPEQELTANQMRQFSQLLERRLSGEPLAYILGLREFWSLQLEVNPDTLIPRPETELLVEIALTHLDDSQASRIADLGTGSGAIALAIGRERPDCHIDATDLKPQTLQTARSNAQRLGIGNLEFHLGSWYSALPRGAHYRLLLSNPPYIADDDPHLCQGDLPREPRAALASGPDGLQAIRQLCADAPAHLEAGGWLIFEHGFEQGAAARSLLQQAGFVEIQTHQDLAGLDRVTEGCLPAPAQAVSQ
jgi:release factor glutamine methyltransferase